jgi:hypothetical protein
LLATLALSAMVASAASAAEWYVNGSLLSGSTAVNAKNNGELTLTSTVLGSPFKLKAKGLSCSGCTISNPGAKSAGKLVFTEVSVVEPSGCKVASTLTTNALVDEVIMDPSNVAGPVFDKFSPAEGTGFITIKVEGCAAAGSYKVNGTATGQSPYATGVEKAEQPLAFGSTQQTTGGGALTLGSNAATLTGEAINTLAAGGVFGAK